MEPFCPNCGARLEEKWSACPECGSCSRTGWSRRARYESMGVDCDDDGFDYEEFVKEEWGGKKRSARSSRDFLWGLVGAFLILVVLSWSFSLLGSILGFLALLLILALAVYPLYLLYRLLRRLLG